MEDLTGKQFGPYRILAPLGEGGMAAVYKAFQPGVDRQVALKVLPRHYAKDPEFVERLEREAKVLARLQHPHILPVHDFGQADGGYTYIVMPFIQGGDLADLMADQQKIRIRLKAYDHNVVDESSKKITETVVRTQAKVKGPVPLPTEIHRYCVIRGPHVDKDSREHFEMRIHKRLIDILEPTPKTVDSLMRLELPAGVEVELKL